MYILKQISIQFSFHLIHINTPEGPSERVEDQVGKNPDPLSSENLTSNADEALRKADRGRRDLEDGLSWLNRAENWIVESQEWDEAWFEEVWETWETSPESLQTERLLSLAEDVGIEPDTLATLYSWSTENNPDLNPENLEADMLEFANQMERLQALVEQTEWLEMPTTPEEFQELMTQLMNENWEIQIPISPEAMSEMWITVDEAGNITIQSPQWGAPITYPWNDAPAWLPQVRWGQVVSGYTWGARPSPGPNTMDIDIENLTPGVQGLVELIYQAEANGDPDIIYGWSPVQPPQPITTMTVREVRQFQDRMVQAWSPSSAVWACQVIRSTLDGAIQSGLLREGELFNEDAQMRFTLGKLNERWLQRFQSWQIDEMTFMRNVSMEWASFPRDMSWASYYAWDGLNHALVSPQQVLSQLRTIRESSGALAA